MQNHIFEARRQLGLEALNLEERRLYYTALIWYNPAVKLSGVKLLRDVLTAFLTHPKSKGSRTKIQRLLEKLS